MPASIVCAFLYFRLLHLLHPGKGRFLVPRDTVFAVRGPKMEMVTFLPRELPRTFERRHIRPNRLLDLECIDHTIIRSS